MFLGLFLSAQETLDILTFSWRLAPHQNYDSIYDGKARETGFSAGLVLPIKISEKSIWYNSINYFHWKVTNEEIMPENIANPIKIHGIIFRTGLYQKFSNGNSFQVFFTPRLMSDFRNIDKNHFQYGGMALYNVKYSESLTVGFGVNYNQELFGPYLVPLINLEWKLSNRWSINGVFPIYAKVKYEINKRLNVGYSHFGLITTYRLGDPEYGGDYIDRRSIDETLFVRYHITKNIHIEGRVGFAFGRSYGQYGADQKVNFSLPLVGFGDDRIQKNVSFHDGFIASLSLVYNISILKD